MNPYSVLLKPLLSEKSNDAREMQNQYSFVIKLDASKTDVKKAVKKMYDVDVKTVRTVVSRGKIKRRGLFLSKPRLKKKAIVTLKEGQAIKIFDDQ